MPGDLAVVLSGGGAKGAFQVGVLDELISKRKVKPKIVVGTSTGAIQALGVAQNDVPGLVAQWMGLKGNSDIYTKRPLGVGGALLGEKAIYNAAPLKKMLKAFADDDKVKRSKIELRLGVVNLGTGLFRTIDQKVPGLHNWVYASCAMPLFFDPLLTRASDGTEEQWVDGGVRDVTPLGTALDFNPRGVIVIRASPKAEVGAVRTYGNLVDIALRAVAIQQSEVSMNDLANATMINDLIAAREVQFRLLEAQGITGSAAHALLQPWDLQLAKYRFAPIRIIEPAQEYCDTLEFNPAKIRTAMEAGRQAVADNWAALQPLLS